MVFYKFVNRLEQKRIFLQFFYKVDRSRERETENYMSKTGTGECICTSFRVKVVEIVIVE